MYYRDFFRKFGASARTKNVRSPTRLPVGKGSANRDKPIFHLPATSGLPDEFIRLCPWEMEFVYAVAARARVGILEVGRFNGGSSFLLSCANPKVPIWSIDLAPQNDALLKELCREHRTGANLNLIVGDSQQSKYAEIEGFDVLFIDGDHRYEGCLADIRNWFPDLAKGGYALFHDSYINTPENRVQEAILDFMDGRGDCEVVVSPLIGAAYWRYPQGSIACLRKK